MLLLSVFLMGSCRKFVEIGPPKTQLVSQTVFENSQTATAALTSIYARMIGDQMSYKIPLQTGLYGDELENFSTGQTAFYTDGVDAKVNSPSDTWTNGYNYIYQCNAVIAGITGSGLDTKVKTQLIAEAQFARAYWYFYIINLYGDAPLVLTTEYHVSGVASRTPTAQVYAQIITDLKAAYANLNTNYVDATDIASTTERVRPNKSVAAALLARVYLYNNSFADAEAQASLVINNANYKLEPLDNVFLINSQEAIWQIPPPTVDNSYNTPEGFGFILTAAPSSSALSQQLLNAFEDGDQRRSHWVGSITDGKTYYFPYKYKQQESQTVSEYSTALRLAEQYLIRAEARAQQNNLSGAVDDLNKIRSRSGLPNTTATNQQALLDAILHERQVELFTEWGHRWLDLKRTGKADAVMGVVAPEKGGTWSSKKQLWPIPQADLLNDPHLSQNPGYEGGGTGS